MTTISQRIKRHPSMCGNISRKVKIICSKACISKIDADSEIDSPL